MRARRHLADARGWIDGLVDQFAVGVEAVRGLLAAALTAAAVSPGACMPPLVHGHPPQGLALA
jgi:hypothetical protein